jgi:hypothetical protein
MFHEPRSVRGLTQEPYLGLSWVASPRNVRRWVLSHTYHCNCRREMTLCTAVCGLSLRERERRWSITNASAIMLSIVSVVEHARQRNS